MPRDVITYGNWIKWIETELTDGSVAIALEIRANNGDCCIIDCIDEKRAIKLLDAFQSAVVSVSKI